MSCWKAALQISLRGVGWERLTIHLLLDVDVPLKPEIHFYTLHAGPVWPFFLK